MGVRQGIITSGLNHLAHDAYSKIKISNFNKSLKQEMIEADINPEDTPEFSKKPIVELLIKVKTLQNLWEMSNYQSFTLKESLRKDLITGFEKLGVTTPKVIEDDKQGKIVYRVKGVESLELSKSTFSSYYQLGTTVGHELVHVIHIINGNFQNWINLYGLNKAIKQAEIYAYKWNISVGDERARKKIKLYQ
ncbi:hypothetical protein [Apibacter adventoris]|uniref:hypothetical protein n=1 Tax=Apibacter adventoris TaxID=1679466 RepID=UPI000CF679B9|nr:hypothetical protein [Apibacter adventoris]PQL94399.1 hypothetical protein C4S76_05885 [Apibacter adventoris]